MIPVLANDTRVCLVCLAFKEHIKQDKDSVRYAMQQRDGIRVLPETASVCANHLRGRPAGWSSHWVAWMRARSW